MAVSPRDVMKHDVVDEAVLSQIEAYVDKSLAAADVREGRSISINYIPPLCGRTPQPGDLVCAGQVNSATAKAVIRLYQKAGWRDVRIDSMHGIITMTCPTYRSTGERVEEPSTE